MTSHQPDVLSRVTVLCGVKPRTLAIVRGHLLDPAVGLVEKHYDEGDFDEARCEPSAIDRKAPSW